jgi:hypothetical protein
MNPAKRKKIYRASLLQKAEEVVVESAPVVEAVEEKQPEVVAEVVEAPVEETPAATEEQAIKRSRKKVVETPAE